MLGRSSCLSFAGRRQSISEALPGKESRGASSIRFRAKASQPSGSPLSVVKPAKPSNPAHRINPTWSADVLYSILCRRWPHESPRADRFPQ